MALNTGAFSEETSHHILLENRTRLAVSGVEEVERFDDDQIVMATCQGELIIRGENLHIEQLSLDGGELRVEGTVDALTYEAPREKGGFFARLLG